MSNNGVPIKEFRLDLSELTFAGYEPPANVPVTGCGVADAPLEVKSCQLRSRSHRIRRAVRRLIIG